MANTIQNHVVVSDYIQRTDLKDFQGKLKKDNPAEIAHLVERIRTKGFSAPIFVWHGHEFILDGHQRIKALELLAKQGETLEDDKIPVVYIKADSEKEAKEKVAEYNSKFSTIDQEVAELWWWDSDLQNLIFNDYEIPEAKTLDDKEAIEDVVPETPEEARYVREGDIFKLGNHTLMCWDSMKEEDVKKLIEWAEGKIHCISDPPYGIAYNPDRHGMIKNDDKILDYTQLAKKYTTGYFCMWTGYQVVDSWMWLIRKTFDAINNVIIWHKGGGWTGDCARTLLQDYEILLVTNRGNEIQGYRGNATWYWNLEEKEAFLQKASKETMKDILTRLGKGEVIWKVGKDDRAEYLHPTQKPVEINQRVLENFTAENENVLDLFGGSGSNLIACEKMNRKCYMMELDPKYVEVIIQRYQEYSGKKVQCLNRKIEELWDTL